MAERLEDYVDVAERIAAFYAKYPDGRLRPSRPWEVRELGDRMFIVYEAAAYRTPDDPLPGVGTAWEPFPGPTPFTRNSELQNAETAAWGRAIVALGLASSRKIASLQEVMARQAEPDAPDPAPALGEGASPAQQRHIHALVKEKQLTRGQLAAVLEPLGVELKEGWMRHLSKGQGGSASALIDRLREFATPPEPVAADGVHGV